MGYSTSILSSGNTMVQLIRKLNSYIIYYRDYYPFCRGGVGGGVKSFEYYL